METFGIICCFPRGRGHGETGEKKQLAMDREIALTCLFWEEDDACVCVVWEIEDGV